MLEYHEQLYVNKFKKLQEMDRIFKNNLSKLTHLEIGNRNAL